MTQEQMQQLAEREFPYLENDNEDFAIRSYNQRSHDKREAYLEGLQTGLSQDRWVPCSERLPDYGEFVLWYDKDGNYFVSKLEMDIDDLMLFNATHWQPLPPKPKSK